MRLLHLMLLPMAIFSRKIKKPTTELAQMDELRRQYQDYLKIFGKKETTNSYNMFLENLSRITNRKCDLHVDRYTDEKLTYVEC